ncbi:MAG: NAD-dependent epimerase/dehydratase family protein [Lentisphaeria bacterium]|nr:NAD-dependent epimerase/dehydratase family protein [Lentisphaeria bacterium]
MKILITGTAGFIGFHAAQHFLGRGWDVAGVDNFSSYYDVRLKRDREAILLKNPGYRSYELDICDHEKLQIVFAEEKPEVVLHLAAQPGVRYSISHPFEYERSNVGGVLSVLECCRHAEKMPKLVFASSSSVYGGNTKMPFEEDDRLDTPVSLYAATKRAGELMAYTYSRLYKMQAIGLRFFTVYGDWYRPDMALHLFADAMLRGRPIKVFNNGDMLRDFTYVDDIVDGVCRVVEADHLPLFDIYNIGNHRSEKLLDVIETLAGTLGVTPKMEMLPMQAGDIYATYASIDKLRKAVGYEPKTTIKEGIPVFAAWFKSYYGL